MVRILLADDDPRIRSIVREYAQTEDWEFYDAADGNEAIRMLSSSPFDLVVLDVMMPGMKGIDVLQRVKAEHPDVRVILLTGQGKTRDGIEGMRHGAFAYLTKPLDLEELLRTISEAISSPEETTHA